MVRFPRIAGIHICDSWNESCGIIKIGIAEAPDEGKPDYTPLYQPFLNKVKAILGEDVDLSEITMEKFLSQTGISFDAIYLGKPCNVTLDYSQYVNMAPLMSGDFEITITMCE